MADNPWSVCDGKQLPDVLSCQHIWISPFSHLHVMVLVYTFLFYLFIYFFLDDLVRGDRGFPS